jgi:hypothetical protein
MISIPIDSFQSDVEEMCRSGNVPYIDAILTWCAKNSIEIETAADFIRRDPVLRSKIQVEAEELNVLKRSARLPI